MHITVTMYGNQGKLLLLFNSKNANTKVNNNLKSKRPS